MGLHGSKKSVDEQHGTGNEPPSSRSTSENDESAVAEQPIVPHENLTEEVMSKKEVHYNVSEGLTVVCWRPILILSAYLFVYIFSHS